MERTSSSSRSHQQTFCEDVASFLARLNLSELTEIFENEEFDMNDVLKLSNDELKDIGVSKLKHRKLITQETQKLRKGTSIPSAAAVSVKQIDKEPEIEIPFGNPEKIVVISSTGAATSEYGGVLGMYGYDEESGFFVQTSTEQSEAFHASSTSPIVFCLSFCPSVRPLSS